MPAPRTRSPAGSTPLACSIAGCGSRSRSPRSTPAPRRVRRSCSGGFCGRRWGAAPAAGTPREGLSESFVDPALAMLRASGAQLRFAARLRAIHFHGRRADELNFDNGLVDIGDRDQVVLAVPAPVAARLVPDLTVPDDHAPIVNAHYRIAPPAGMPLFAGLVGGAAEWVFRKHGVVSVTISAADRIVDWPAGELGD